MNPFPAKLDSLSKMLSILLVVVLIIPFITIGQHYGANHDYKIIVVPVLIVVVFLFLALFRPKFYLVNASVLKIIQVGFSRTIPMENIESIEPVDKTALGTGLRTFGNGGFMGYTGKYWYSKAGHITFYVTDRSKLMLVKLKNGKKIMISPDDQDGFLNAYKAAKP